MKLTEKKVFFGTAKSPFFPVIPTNYNGKLE
jgi:hypothetical protein